MKAVVTGGSGFIGSHIVDVLAREGHEVVIFDAVPPSHPLPKNATYTFGDIRSFSLLDQAMQGAEEVYDIAGLLGTQELLACNQLAVEVNIVGALNVLEACRKHDVKRLFHPTKPNDWLNTYSITKHAAEMFYLMYRAEYGMEITVLRWFNAYGPRQHLYPVRKAVPMFIAQALFNLPLQIYGGGEQTTDQVFVEDLARIVVQATRRCGKLGKVLDVGTGKPTTVNELARIIVRLANSSSPIVRLPMRRGEPPRSNIVANVEDLRKHLDIGSLTSVEDGMKKTIPWYAARKEELQRALDYFAKAAG